MSLTSAERSYIDQLKADGLEGYGHTLEQRAADLTGRHESADACSWCGQTFWSHPSRGKLYCTPSCRQDSANARRKRARTYAMAKPSPDHQFRSVMRVSRYKFLTDCKALNVDSQACEVAVSIHWHDGVKQLRTAMFATVWGDFVLTAMESLIASLGDDVRVEAFVSDWHFDNRGPR